MRNNYWFYDSAISPEYCEKIIEHCKMMPSEEGDIFMDDQFGKKSDLRKSTVRWVQDVPEITDVLWRYAWESNRMAYNFDINCIFEVQFTEYHGDENGFYTWHHDIDYTADVGYDRKISIVVQLSNPENYEGGDFQFRDLDAPENFKNRGSVLTFPSYLEHQVTPVTKGKRYSLVTWVEGPRWR